MSKKIDNSGCFLPFVGFTTVANVYDRNQELFQRLHDQLSNSIIAEYNTLLPPSSYHITTFAIIAKKKLNDQQWSTWKNKNLRSLRLVHSALETETAPFTFQISDLHRKLLSILVDVEPGAAYLQRNVARDAGYEKKIPPSFHISLATNSKTFLTKTQETELEMNSGEYWQIQHLIWKHVH